MSAAPERLAEPVRLRQLGGGPVARRIVADEGQRRRIARELGLDRLDRLEADMTVSAWMDGAEISARWRADIEQTCGVTLEPLPAELAGQFVVHAVPAGSPNAPAPPEEEQFVDLEAEDPPDVLDGEEIDLWTYLVEHLALQIDPFPRKPGAVFEPPDEPQPPSPFEALRNFKAGPGQR
jgi:hypothetical protein